MAVWLPVQGSDAWVHARVERRSDGELWAVREHYSTSLEQAPTVECRIGDAEAKVLSEAPVDFAAPANLTDLESIQLPAVLHSLRLRHAVDAIYTAVGAVIIAINPFKPTPESTEERLEQLLRHEDPDTLPPHVFNVARSAYSVMCTTGDAQSVLISGESGAGKTETAKICMTCLAKLSSSSDEATANALESGLLLEAFGNAKTVMNDNSSRFGKWVEVKFDGRHCIAGCHIRCYLLEISRVVRQAEGERNYHVFLQMLAGATADERGAFGLPPTAAPADFRCGDARP